MILQGKKLTNPTENYGPLFQNCVWHIGLADLEYNGSKRAMQTKLGTTQKEGQLKRKDNTEVYGKSNNSTHS